jgi:FkbM family methyltransferase
MKTRLMMRAQHLIERHSGYKLIRNFPPGVNLADDIRRELPRLRVDNVVDVGANRGAFTRFMLESFPGCRCYCLEPVASTHTALVESLRGYSNVVCDRLGLSRHPGSGQMTVSQGDGDRSKLAAPGDSEGVEVVELDTLVGYCSRRAIDHIGVLKIDTEGHDLDVLYGAQELLAQERASLIQVEAGMNMTNRFHVPFQRFVEFFDPLGYRVFHLYEQMSEWTTREPHLRRADVVFVSPRTITENRRPVSRVP